MKKTQDSATSAQGKQVITACAFVYRFTDGVTEVFLPKRALTKKFLPGIYELPGGHIDYGEDITAGLKREIKEELGATIELGEPFAVFTYLNEVKGSHSIEVVYFGQFTEPDKKIKLNPEDHSEYGWFSKEKVIAMRDSIVPQGQVTYDYEHEDDPEYLAILRGFEKL